jgi:pyrimidine-nucleoside phosphorylase
VGLAIHKRLGDKVERGEALVTLHYNSDMRVKEARGLIESAYRVGDSAPILAPLVQKVIGA